MTQNRGMDWCDTHCHLDVGPLAGDLAGVLQRAWEAGVRRILVPGIRGPVPDPGFPSWVGRAWGIHPGAADGVAGEGGFGEGPGEDGIAGFHVAGEGFAGDGGATAGAFRNGGTQDGIPASRGAPDGTTGAGWPAGPVDTAVGPIAREVRALFSRRTYAPRAIGETGLDVRAKVPLARQEAVFRAQVELAREQGLPLLLHVFGAWERTLAILKECGHGIPWVLHSFSGSWETARLFLREAEPWVSFSGSLCRPNARKTPRVAREVPGHRCLLETDAPDLPPPWWPGRYNEPAALPAIGRFLADLRAEPLEQVNGHLQEAVRAVWPDW